MGAFLSILLIVLFLFLLFKDRQEFVDQKTTAQVYDASNTTLQRIDNLIVIDFALCKPDRKRFSVSFGSTTIQIIGVKEGFCELKYGGEVENPKWDGKLPNFCRVPVSLGIVEFPTHQYGADYSAIGEFCVKK